MKKYLFIASALVCGLAFLVSGVQSQQTREIVNGGRTYMPGVGTNVQMANEGATGTTLNKLAKLTGAPSTAIITATSDTSGAIGIVVAGAAITGSADIAIAGQASCIFDGATTAGHYVQISSTTAGDCHDAGTSFPTSGQVLGLVLSTNGSGGTYAIQIFPPGIMGDPLGTVTSVGLTGFTNGIFSTAGSPVTTSGNLAVTILGTSGGVPYFSSSSVLSSSAALTANGIVYGGGAGNPPVATAAGTAKQVLTAGNPPAFIDFPATYDVPAANCNNTSGGAGWSIGSGGAVTCRAGTNDLGGYISISDTSSTFATFQVAIPEDWDSSSNPYIRVQLASTDATNGHTVIPEINVACYKGDGSTNDDVVANGFHSLSTITLNANANRLWSTSWVQMNSTDMTGCVAGALMQVTVGRATDTATNAEFYSATVTFPRLLTVQAN